MTDASNGSGEIRQLAHQFENAAYEVYG